MNDAQLQGRRVADAARSFQLKIASPQCGIAATTVMKTILSRDPDRAQCSAGTVDLRTDDIDPNRR